MVTSRMATIFEALRRLKPGPRDLDALIRLISLEVSRAQLRILSTSDILILENLLSWYCPGITLATKTIIILLFKKILTFESIWIQLADLNEIVIVFIAKGTRG